MIAQTQHPQIDAALARARARWLNSATINAGGRWAVLPAAAAAVVGVSLAVAGVRDVLPLAAVGAVGVAGVIAALVMTRQTFARPGRPGAPDYTLALDRALGLNDALPALVESPGAFSGALAERVARGLDPVRERQAAPPRQWASLVVALLLCLLPLAALTPDALAETPPPKDQTAQQPKEQPELPAVPPPPASGDQPEKAEPQPGENQGKGEGNGGGGSPEGQPQPQPGQGNEEGPKDKPKPDPNAKPEQQPKGAGDNIGPPPKPPEETPEEKVDSRDTPITPEAGKGDTREEVRRRWLYDPDGAVLPGAQPNVPRMESQGESAIPRQKVTTTERRTLERLYEKLFR